MTTQQIIESKINQVIAILQQYKKKPDPQVLFKADLRGVLFSIEGILRLHLKTNNIKFKYHQELAQKSLAKLKELEDLLGLYSLYDDIEKFAKENHLKPIKRKYTQIQLEEYIFTNWIIPHYKSLKDPFARTFELTPIYKLQIDLLKINFPENSNKNIKQMLSQEIKRVNKKNKALKQDILKDKTSIKNLEEGFHEWRRAIRWVSIYIQSYRDQFYLNPEKKLGRKEKEMYLKNKNNPFTQLSKDKKQIQLNKTQFLILSEYIQRLGEAKEMAEYSLYLNAPGIYSVKTAHHLYQDFMKTRCLNKLLL